MAPTLITSTAIGSERFAACLHNGYILLATGDNPSVIEAYTWNGSSFSFLTSAALPLGQVNGLIDVYAKRLVSDGTYVFVSANNFLGGPYRGYMYAYTFDGATFNLVGRKTEDWVSSYGPDFYSCHSVERDSTYVYSTWVGEDYSTVLDSGFRVLKSYTIDPSPATIDDFFIPSHTEELPPTFGESGSGNVLSRSIYVDEGNYIYVSNYSTLYAFSYPLSSSYITRLTSSPTRWQTNNFYNPYASYTYPSFTVPPVSGSGQWLPGSIMKDSGGRLHLAGGGGAYCYSFDGANFSFLGSWVNSSDQYTLLVAQESGSDKVFITGNPNFFENPALFQYNFDPTETTQYFYKPETSYAIPPDRVSIAGGNKLGYLQPDSSTIIAVSGFNLSAYSLAIALSAPTNLTGNRQAILTNVDLSWDSVSGATNYVVERDTDSGFSSPTEVYNNTGTSFTDVVSSAITVYYYRVKATAGVSESPWSATATVPGAIAKPLNLRLVSGIALKDVLVSWDAVENADNYVLQRSLDESFTSPLEVFSGLDTNYDDEIFLVNVKVYYRVKAQNIGSSIDSEWSDIKSISLVNKFVSTQTLDSAVNPFDSSSVLGLTGSGEVSSTGKGVSVQVRASSGTVYPTGFSTGKGISISFE